jgi:hypothetical protein
MKRWKEMKKIDLSNLAEDKETLSKIAALSYYGLGVYLGLKQLKPVKRVAEPPREVRQSRARPRTLSEMVGRLIEETYGIERP